MALDQHDQLPARPASYRKLFPWKVQSKIQLPLGTRREQASALFQLKLGHGYIKSYLYRLRHLNSDLCQCGKKETAEHLLLSCNKLVIARKVLQNKLEGLRLSLQLLLHTKTGIEETLEFLKATKIVTRKWHLAKKEEKSKELAELIRLGEEDD